MQSIHVDTAFWKHEKGEGQSLKIQIILFICDILIFTQNLPFRTIFKSEFLINWCGKCVTLSESSPHNFWKGWPFWPQLYLDVV